MAQAIMNEIEETDALPALAELVFTIEFYVGADDALYTVADGNLSNKVLRGTIAARLSALSSWLDDFADPKHHVH
jgi:hypothetical protein